MEHLRELAAVSSLQWARLLGWSERLGLDSIVDEFSLNTDAQDPEWDLRAIELKLRQLSSQGAAWVQIKDLAWRLLRLTRTEENGAKLVELCFMSGSIHDSLDAIVKMNEEGFGFYHALDGRFREHLVFKLMQIHKEGCVAGFLDFEGNQSELRPIERLLLFRRFDTEYERAERFMYFRSHETEILEAIAKHGPGIKLSPAAFYVEMAAEAVALGFNDLAKRLVKEISPEQEEYNQALELQMVIDFDPADPASEHYFRKLERAADWRERLQLIGGFLQDCRKRVGTNDIRRPSLNEILADWTKWLPDSPTAISEFSALLSQHCDLDETLPSMMNLYRESALKFQVPSVEAAVWKPVLHGMLGEKVTHRYWRGVAALHIYLALGDGNEELLWSAKRRIEAAEDKWAFVLPFKWAELHAVALEAAIHQESFTETQRELVISQLRIAAQITKVSLRDVELYLHHQPQPPASVLEELQTLVASKGALQLESQLLRIFADRRHYRTSDLDRLWTLAHRLNDHDLAWRVATVLEGRGSLDQRYVQPWSVSGENRSEYTFHKVAVPEIALAMSGFSKEEKKLCAAVLLVGPHLPELLASMQSAAVSLKLESPVSGTFEHKVEEALSQLGWIPQQKRVFRFGSEGILSTSIQLPSFLNIMPSNTWSYLYLRMAERLGLNAWSWKLSRLFEMIDEVLPRYAHSKTNEASKLAKWLRTMKPEVRSAWQDLGHLRTKVDDQRCLDVLACFLMRLSIAIYPAHVQALKSIRTMRAPVSMVWELENWILSDEYSRIRRDQTMLSRVQIPIHLRQIERISAKSLASIGD